MTTVLLLFFTPCIINTKPAIKINVKLSVTLLLDTFFCLCSGRKLLIDVSPWIVVYVSTVFLYVLINFIMAGIKDPGVYPKRMFSIFMFFKIFLSNISMIPSLVNANLAISGYINVNFLKHAIYWLEYFL